MPECFEAPNVHSDASSDISTDSDIDPYVWKEGEGMVQSKDGDQSRG